MNYADTAEIGHLVDYSRVDSDVELVSVEADHAYAD